MSDGFSNKRKQNTIRQTKPPIVLDTNVLVTGLYRPEGSPSYKILGHIQQGHIPLVLTKKLFFEYESVLTRENILKLIGASLDEIQLVLDALLAIAQKSEVYYLWRPNLPDKSDNFVLESAVAAGAIIITKNIKDFRTGEIQFPELIVLTPQQFCDIYL